MRSEETSKLFGPVWGQKPRSSKRYRSSDSLRSPKGEGSINSVDGIRSLWFAEVVGKSAYEVTTLCSKFVGTDSFFHVEASDRVGAEVLDYFPKFDSSCENRMVKSSANMSRCRFPTKFAPEG